MNLNAHPLTVAAELAWKQDHLGHANLRPAPRQRARAGARWHLPRPLRRRPRATPQGTPRPA